MSETRQPISFSLHDEVDGRPINLGQTNAELVDEHNQPNLEREIDEEKLKSLWRNGEIAWAGITNPTEWVEELRSL